MSDKALRTGSPADKDGIVVEDDCVKIWTISCTACLKKSVIFISGNVITCGMESTVSVIRVNLVRVT